MGIIYMKLFHLTQREEYQKAAIKLALSLYSLNGDTDGLLRSRTLTPYWKHDEERTHD